MAYKKKRTFKRKFAKKRGYKRKSAARVKVTRGFKIAVKRVLRRQAEKKHVNVVDLGMIIMPSNSATADGAIQQLSPGTGSFQIQQGTGQADRVGDRIQITRCTLKGTIVPNIYDVTTNPAPQPCVVQLIVFYDKLNTTIYPAPFAANNFFQFGNTVAGFRNDLVDNWAMINSDRYTVVLRKHWKLGYAAYGGTGTTAAAQAFTNNDFKLNHEFSLDMTKYLVKNVKYQDNNIDPTTRGLWFTFVATASDGTAYGAGRIPAHVQYSQDLTYIDV